MDEDKVNRALLLDPEWERSARATWLALMDLAVWGDVRSSRLGAAPQVRKRALDVGEKLRSLTASRGWIPHPRERLKSALATARNLRQSVAELAHASRALDAGTERDAFGVRLAELCRCVERLAPLESHWAALLDSEYREDGA